MSRPEIPAGVARSVRQRCGFGCVLCGLPLYDYDHIIGWALTERHETDEITLLCSEHHRMKTSGLLSREQVERANSDPINVRRGVTRPFGLAFGGHPPEISIGGDTFTAPEGDLAPLVVDDVPVLAFVRTADDELLLNLTLRDEINAPRLIVENNVLQMAPDMWDVEFVGQVLTVRRKSRDIFVRIRFVPPSRVAIERARILVNGVIIEVQPSGIILNNRQFVFQGNRWEGGLGVTVGHCPHYYHPLEMLRLHVDRYSWAPPPDRADDAGSGAAKPRP